MRQQPGTYFTGPQTLDKESDEIDPLFSNKSLEYYTKRRGVHRLQRLLVRVLSDREPSGGAGRAAADARAALATARKTAVDASAAEAKARAELAAAVSASAEKKAAADSARTSADLAVKAAETAEAKAAAAAEVEALAQRAVDQLKLG